LLFLKFLIIFSLGANSFASEKYTGDEAPPETGWKSAVKYFGKNGSVKTRTRQAEVTVEDSDASSSSRVLFLDNIVFVNNRVGSSLDEGGQWGLKLGYEWDDDWYAKGFYIQHSDYDLERKFSVLGGLVFPSLASRFPLYLKANVGLGYFVGDFDSETLAVEYNAHTGVRFFARNGMLFNIEIGSANYTRLLTHSYLNSLVMSSGLAFRF